MAEQITRQHFNTEAEWLEYQKQREEALGPNDRGKLIRQGFYLGVGFILSLLCAGAVWGVLALVVIILQELDRHH